MQQVIFAHPAIVYKSLVSSDDVAQWMVPSGMTAKVHAFEPVEGGTIHITLTYDDPSIAGKTDENFDTYKGIFEQLVPGEKVVQLVEFDSDDPSHSGRMRITINLEEKNGGTTLTAIHENVPDGVDPELNEIGWAQSLDKLATLIENRKRGFR